MEIEESSTMQPSSTLQLEIECRKVRKPLICEVVDMPKGRLITRSVTNTRPINMTLNLECTEEALSEAQLMSRIKYKENFDRVSAILEELVKDHGGKLICQVGTVNGYQYTLPGTAQPAPMGAKSSSQPMVSTTNKLKNQGKAQPIKLNMLNNTNASQGNIQLVMDPRMGVILGTVAQAQQSTAPPVTTTAVTTVAPSQQENYKYTRSGRRTKVLQVQQPDIIEEPPPTPTQQQPLPRGRPKSVNATHVVTPTTTSPQGVTNLRIKTVNKQQVPATVPRPTEHTSIGGISVGNNTAAGEQIDETKKNQPDGREITFNKMNGGRTYPSLVVVARPNLRIKDVAPQTAQKDRADLDMKVKSVLMFSATKFAEWLIQQGLVRSEQYCTTHSKGYQKIKLKLGMYSDTGTFPYSGGYVWISSCCPDRFVSVFSGSLFQGATHTPTVLLKLIYHWACQTNVQNVVSWVKVPNFYVKNFYTNLRSVCTAAVWDKCKMMGGKNSMIQVGVISLGTTSQDGNLRQVKVEVLGILDPETLELRLRACEPVHDGDRSFKRRFNNILHPLKDWVHKDSKILTDFTVDKSTLQEMGFTNITQTAFSEQTTRNSPSNYHIMEYLRKIVPRMFQNTLSLLSREMIQQFLDELVWRELFGSTAWRAFDNIITHIAEQTRLDTNDCLLDRLQKIAANPFQDWSYSMSNPPPLAPMSLPKEPLPVQSNIEPAPPLIKPVDPPPVRPGPGRRGRKRIHPLPTPEEREQVKRATPDSKIKDRDNKGEQVHLQEHYYASMEGDKNTLLKEHKSSLFVKCFLCSFAMRSNTDVMEHMIVHVPPQVPGQLESPVCRYCCTAFSSKHQISTHVAETHSTFGQSNGDMVVCAICEQKFGSSSLLANHLSTTHNPSEMPYLCEACGYRTSSHKDVIDHFYHAHEKGEGLQCPFCLKVMQLMVDGAPHPPTIHAFLLHMQRHIVRREEGRGNKCSRCCLWFNQKSALVLHQKHLHDQVSGSKVVPYSGSSTTIMVPRHRHQNKHFEVDSPPAKLSSDDSIKKWTTGPVKINAPISSLQCQECEEDIDEPDHYPGEQKCQQCRYVTCCWRAFKEHQQQIHKERPKTGLVILSPLINIPLENRMQCPCGFITVDGNQLATHLIKCKRISAYPMEEPGPSGMLDSLGLVPKVVTDIR
ncbi:uncharacterized protein LOC105702483 isoform X3 [Orussus abietinus]|nr:uncharacterized protein LOC105702483 isoform X3 [Orussus abietinus]XP_012285508.1 uncharacterized protein LOC105702483 isoform X3 [Orussus abietinus]XP_012285509.1 uncharacterized protein LOC105702483 isoform X3 [Orussus abietinus]XP_023288214.1 uncharacterized protein LOC105702483 isoform X3 [Orussus abietinus]